MSASCAAVVASTVKAREATEALTPGLVEDLASNPALRALYGTPFDLATPGGFTVWRLGMFLAATTSLWGLLTATRLLRGEEDAGRADLVLTAPISRRRLTDVTMLVVAAAAPIIGAAVALGFIATSQAVSSSALFGAGIALLTLDFIAVGGLTSQLFGTRRRASGAAGLALGATFLLRMVADGSSGLGWLRWFTPFGWLEELRPFADERAFPLALLAALAVGLGGLALALSRQRDLGDGIVRERDTAELRPRLLQSPLGFQWRQGLGRARRLGSRARRDRPRHRRHHQRIHRLRRREPGRAGLRRSVRLRRPRDRGRLRGVDGCVRGNGGRAVRRDGDQPRLGGRAGSAGSSSRTPTPVTRPEWLGASVASTVSAALIVSAGCALATWVAVQAANGDLGLADAALGLVNTLPAVAVFLGTAVLLVGVKPEVTRLGAGGFVIVALFISVFGPTMKLPGWALDLSPFHHLAPAPAAPVAWGATTVLLVLAAALSLAGFVAYRQRDLRG